MESIRACIAVVWVAVTACRRLYEVCSAARVVGVGSSWGVEVATAKTAVCVARAVWRD